MVEDRGEESESEPPMRSVEALETSAARVKSHDGGMTSTMAEPQTKKEEEPVVAPYSAFSPRARGGIVCLVSAAGLFSPLAGNIYFPAIPSIAVDLSVSVQAINMTVVSYMLFQGFTPTIWGAASDVIGRRPIYLVTFLVFIGACFALANTNVYWLLIVLRCIQAAGSASVVALGSGSIGDIAAVHERGGWMGIFGLGPMLGPCVGPILGGVLTDHFDWHAPFWFLAVLATLVFAIMLFFLPETLRSIVGNGSIPARGVNVSLTSYLVTRSEKRKAERQDVEKSQLPEVVSIHERPPRKTFRDIDLLAPLKILFLEVDVLILLTYNSVGYTLFYCSVTTLADSFKKTYGLSESEIGLCFLANGAGCLLCSAINGKRMNRDYRIVKEAHDKKQALLGIAPNADSNDLSDFPIEHARLRSMPVCVVGLIACTLGYGWSLDRGVHLSVPLIFQFGVGASSTMQFNMISTLLIDLFPGQGASAVAANNLYRCFLGAAGTALIEPILRTLGTGPGFTLVSAITLAFVPLLWLEWKYGSRFRANRAQKIERRREKQADRAAHHSH